jgi:dihydroorotate dehydrogenase
VAVSAENIDKPLFIKMPITESDSQVREMLSVLSNFPAVKGVIFGNLWKDRTSKALVKEEVENLGRGNFSGAPTFDRSNELIALAYKEFGTRFTIIGCGGVFNGADAYKKIRLGASLIQMITGLIFEGPQLPAQINLELINLLKKDGFKNISEAVGVDNK